MVLKGSRGSISVELLKSVSETEFKSKKVYRDIFGLDNLDKKWQELQSLKPEKKVLKETKIEESIRKETRGEEASRTKNKNDYPKE